MKIWLDNLDASSFIRDIVLYGYRLPFAVLPWPIYEQFAISFIAELLQAGCTAQSNEYPLECTPLYVVENASSKLRLALEIKYVNHFLPQ